MSFPPTVFMNKKITNDNPLPPLFYGIIGILGEVFSNLMEIV